jgi:glycine dehydrogenase
MLSDADGPLSGFVTRHLGPDEPAIEHMLDVLGLASLEDLVDAVLPEGLRDPVALGLPPRLSEEQATAALLERATANVPGTPMIGLGYSATVTPPVIRRNVLEAPSWYTAYTPYQPEISQGRLEALLNFQTLVGELAGLPTANASLLDEATAAAEAITLMRRASRSASSRVIIDAEVLPQTLAVIRTRCTPLGIEVVVDDLLQGLPDGDAFGVLLQLPGASGALRDLRAVTAEAHERGALVTVALDPLAAVLLEPPGTWGADVVISSLQRFGVPLGYGGPHAASIAVREGLERSLPGRLVGVSVDADGQPAYRLALQTREQHIRRERATSNICTAQVLLAVVSGMYAVWHGPDGLRAIAERVHRRALQLAGGLRAAGIEVVHERFFDTVLARVPGHASEVVAAAARAGIDLGEPDEDHVRIACDERTDTGCIVEVLRAFGIPHGSVPAPLASPIPADLRRRRPFLEHAVFHQHRSETAMLRYLRRLADRDYALDRGMIPLGSCTMKLNATSQMEPISWPGFADLHPFAPASRAAGYLRMIAELESWLATVTGYAAVSVQPNAGSQGEFAGLLAIAAYHRDRGDTDRDVCLIPSSAHGTNAASAVMAGLRVAVVAATEGGTIDLEDLRARLLEHEGRVAAIMVTYPSTHGVYEAEISEACALVHDAGGQVYIDGANLNALVGLASPGRFGGDVSHLNLHKTFCIPHGGGGPGVGPIAVAEHLVPYLPSHPLHPDPARRSGPVGPVSAAPFGSAGVLPIPWAYIRAMGGPGLTRATQVAVLAANYVTRRLSPHYPILYAGPGGWVAHEAILDLRELTRTTGVTAEDVAKRLIDYGFHAPTLSFPVAGTLMIEPTESEDLAELDRFCEAMIAIRREIDRIADGTWPRDDNPLLNAPHTAEMLVGAWDHPYGRAEAVYPVADLRRAKYWPPVRRIDGAHGDRNLVCSCPPIEAFAQNGAPA